MHVKSARSPSGTVGFKPRVILFLTVFAGLGIVFSGVLAPTAQAIRFETGEIEGSIDTTVTLGTDLRMESANSNLIGFTNGGRQFSINTDNGTQNFDLGEPIDGGVKVLHELDVTWRNYGFFGRFYYFYDWALMMNDKRRYPLTEAAENYSGRNIKLLDAYLTADYTLLGRPLTLRLGNQVLSWGESTFIQFGINTINPVDVSKLRAAGSELRDALLPLPMVDLQVGITEDLSLEGFYQFYWLQTEIEPTSTFFSTNDFAGPGGKYIWLGFGLPPATDHPPSPVGSNPPIGTHTYRLDDNKAADMGQGGVALRYFADWLNDTELGLYYVHYHSRMPYFSGRTGTAPPPYPDDPTDIVQWLSHLPLLQYGLLSGDYASTAGLIRDYPEDIDMVGLGFSTDFPQVGLAIQGEVSYRPNVPIQVDDVEVLFGALSPMDPYLNALRAAEAILEGHPPPAAGPIFGNGQLGTLGFNQFLEGWRRKQILQPQLTLTKILGPTFGFIDQLVVLGEVGAMWVMDMEDQSVLRYEGPGTFTSGNPWFTFAGVQPATTVGGFATPLSWGYRLALRADILNAIGPVTLQPTLAFSHDVDGVSPSPTVSFIEGRMAGTVALTADYLNRYRFQISYTNYFSVKGDKNQVTKQLYASNLADTSVVPRDLILQADQYNNLLVDRDYLSFTFSVSF